jgi:hypothetical protein
VTPGQILAYTQQTIKNYIKTVTTIDNSTLDTNTSTYNIDLTDYNNTIESTKIRNFSNGAGVTEIITKYTQTTYDYEQQQNESNRTINLVNSTYVSSFESQLSTLMNK